MDGPRMEGPKVRFRGPFTSEYDGGGKYDVIVQDGLEVGSFPGRGKVAVTIGVGAIVSPEDVVAIGSVELDALPDGRGPCHVVAFEADNELAGRIFGGDLVPCLVGLTLQRDRLGGRRIISCDVMSVALVPRAESLDPNCTFWEPAMMPVPRIVEKN